MATADLRAIARAAGVTAVAVALGVLSWMSASDRATARSSRPQMSFFGGDPAAKVALDNLAHDDPQAALLEARRAVRTAPVDPSTTSALGSSLLTLGRLDQAYAAFTVAGTLGWRDIPTQIYWLAQAQAVGDVGVLAQRLDALLRLDIRHDAVANSLNILGQSPLGQQALAMLLLKDPPWQPRFLVGTGDLDGADLEGRMAAIDLAAKQGAPIDCEAVGIAAGRLVRNDNARLGRQLWQQACDRNGGALLSDNSFETDPSITSHSPFTWQLRSEGGLDVAIQPAPAPLRGHALKIRSAKTVRTNAATQFTTLEPGRYRLSWLTARDDGRSDASITIMVRCEGAGELTDPYATPNAARDNRAATTFSVPSQGCPVQTVVVQKAANGLGEIQTGWIDDIRLSPIGAESSAAAL